MKAIVNFDGACEPVNPGGVAAYGFVIRDPGGEVLEKGRGVVGEGDEMTNNVAEYTAAIEALKWIGENLDSDGIVLRGDSELVIKQLSGEYAVNSSSIRPLYKELKDVIGGLDAGFEAEWVPREGNEKADALSKEAVAEYIEESGYEIDGHSVVKCDRCGAWMTVKRGPYGKFYGCSRYPKCENTKSLGEVEE